MTHSRFSSWMVASLLLEIGCQGPPGFVTKGTYGGVGAEMTVTDTGASVQFNCASGVITQQLKLSGNGDFTWSGTYTRIFAVPMGPTDSAHVATFSGTARGSRVIFQVNVPDISVIAGPYDVSRDQASQLAICP